MKRLKTVVLAVVVLVTAVSVLVAPVVVWCVLLIPYEYGGFDALPVVLGDPLGYSNSPFDAHLWREPARPLELPSPRYRMAKSLVEAHLHKGMTEGEVTDLLGPPDKTWPRDDGTGLQKLEYALGSPFNHLCWYTWWLLLYFDDSGKYVDYHCSDYDTGVYR